MPKQTRYFVGYDKHGNASIFWRRTKRESSWKNNLFGNTPLPRIHKRSPLGKGVRGTRISKIWRRK